MKNLFANTINFSLIILLCLSAKINAQNVSQNKKDVFTQNAIRKIKFSSGNKNRAKKVNLNDSTYNYYWNSEVNDWIYYSRNNYTYNVKQKLIETINSHWNIEDNLWENYSYNVYTYNENNNLTINIFSYWNAETNDWKNYIRNIYTYNESNDITETINYQWNDETNQWTNYSNSRCIYDIDNNLIERISSKWSTENNEWNNLFHEIFTYDKNKNLIDEICEFWNNTDNDWETKFQAIHNYGDIDFIDLYYKNNELNEWSIYFRISLIKDENDNRIEEIYSNWDAEKDKWVDSYKNNFIYNEENNLSEIIRLNWYENLNNWFYDYREVYFYALYTGIEESTQNDFLSIFPNPSNGKFKLINNDPSVNNFKVEILNINGQIIYGNEFNSFNNIEKIDLSNVSKGLYFIKTKYKNNVVVKEIIIQ